MLSVRDKGHREGPQDWILIPPPTAAISKTQPQGPWAGGTALQGEPGSPSTLALPLSVAALTADVSVTARVLPVCGLVWSLWPFQREIIVTSIF